MYKCTALHCSPETITTLLIGSTPIQNIFGVKKKLKIKKKEKTPLRKTAGVKRVLLWAPS